jgi:hypothetical protein
LYKERVEKKGPQKVKKIMLLKGILRVPLFNEAGVPKPKNGPTRGPPKSAKFWPGTLPIIWSLSLRGPKVAFFQKLDPTIAKFWPEGHILYGAY